MAAAAVAVLVLAAAAVAVLAAAAVPAMVLLIQVSEEELHNETLADGKLFVTAMAKLVLVADDGMGHLTAAVLDDSTAQAPASSSQITEEVNDDPASPLPNGSFIFVGGLQQ